MGLSSAAHHAAAAAAAASSLQFFYQGGDPLGQPPPAHMGIPPYQLDPKTAGAMGKLIVVVSFSIDFYFIFRLKKKGSNSLNVWGIWVAVLSC